MAEFSQASILPLAAWSRDSLGGWANAGHRNGMHVLEPELRIISFTASLIPCCCSAARLSYDHMDRDGWATALDWSKHSNGEVIFSRRPETKDGSGGLFAWHHGVGHRARVRRLARSNRADTGRVRLHIGELSGLLACLCDPDCSGSSVRCACRVAFLEFGSNKLRIDSV